MAERRVRVYVHTVTSITRGEILIAVYARVSLSLTTAMCVCNDVCTNLDESSIPSRLLRVLLRTNAHQAERRIFVYTFSQQNVAESFRILTVYTNSIIPARLLLFFGG